MALIQQIVKQVIRQRQPICFDLALLHAIHASLYITLTSLSGQRITISKMDYRLGSSWTLPSGLRFYFPASPNLNLNPEKSYSVLSLLRPDNGSVRRQRAGGYRDFP